MRSSSVGIAPGDLGDLPALRRQADALVDAAGGFDFLVNNAAIDPVAPIEAYSLEEFLVVQTINAHAAFVLCQAVTPSMKTSGPVRVMASSPLAASWVAM